MGGVKCSVDDEFSSGRKSAALSTQAGGKISNEVSNEKNRYFYNSKPGTGLDGYLPVKSMKVFNNT